MSYFWISDKSWTLEEEDYKTCWGAASYCCFCILERFVYWGLYMLILIICCSI